MKKAIRFLLAFTAAGTMMAGCARSSSGAFSPAGSCVYVAKDGAVSSAMVEKYEGEAVDEKDLRQYLEAAVIRYNEGNGGSGSAQNQKGSGQKLPAALSGVTAKNGVMTAIFDYASVEDLVKFRQTDDNADDSSTFSAIEVKTVAEADSAGWLSEALAKPDGSQAEADEVKKESEASVASVEGGGTMMFSGKVLFMTEGVTKQDEYTVTIPDGGKTYVVFK